MEKTKVREKTDIKTKTIWIIGKKEERIVHEKKIRRK